MPRFHDPYESENKVEDALLKRRRYLFKATRTILKNQSNLSFNTKLIYQTTFKRTTRIKKSGIIKFV